jgi:hypothetical protein
LEQLRVAAGPTASACKATGGCAWLLLLAARRRWLAALWLCQLGVAGWLDCKKVASLLYSDSDHAPVVMIELMSPIE